MKRFNSIGDIRTYVELIDVENEEYEGWDNQGFRVLLKLTTPKCIQSLEVVRADESPVKEEALKAFVSFAAAEGASFSVPPGSDELVVAYEALEHEVQLAWRKLPWHRRMLRRF